MALNFFRLILFYCKLQLSGDHQWELHLASDAAGIKGAIALINKYSRGDGFHQPHK